MAFHNSASSSAQQAFATPQPSPLPSVTPGAQAISPPTKQSLKSWWKQFRPPAKGNSETQGTYPHHNRSQDLFKQLYNCNNTNTSLAASEPVQGRFKESDMVNESPAVAGIPGSELSFPVSQGAARQFSLPTFETIQISVPNASSSTPMFVQSSIKQASKRHSTYISPFSADSSDSFEPRKLPSQITRTSLQLLPLGTVLNRSKKSFSKEIQAFDYSTSPERDTVENTRTPVARRNSLFASFLAPRANKNRKANRVKKAEQPTGIFGVPLRQSITYANVAISLVDAEGRSYIYGYVPIVVAKCGVYLKEKATNVEGIFRLSGSEKRIKELKTIFDSPDRYGKGLDWAGYTVHDAANVLRRYLNQLPEPIVPLDLYGPFRNPLRGHTMEAVGDTEGPQLKDTFNIDDAIKTYQKLITELPPLNRQLLLYILDLLAVFASKSDENRMTAQNLAAIFQPGILSHPHHDMAPKEYRLSQDVLIFLIENQDHFLIGMRGTAADERTVQEVQNGGTPPPGTPKTPAQKTSVARSASNASAGADSVRKYGGIRRNVSVSSKNSRQSNGAASPGSPSLNSSSGVHRSNTVPSKRSPALTPSRLKKHSGSPSPTAPVFVSSDDRAAAPRGLSPAPAPSTERSGPPSPGLAPATLGTSSLSQDSNAASTITSQERLLGEQQEIVTPSKERNVPNFFQRSPTMDNEKKQPNKLRKKRHPGSSNPSAQSSTQSLSQQPASISPGILPADVPEQPILEAAQSDTHATPPMTETPRAEQSTQYPPIGDDIHPTGRNLQPVASPTTSLRSHSSFNDQSDADHREDIGIVEEQREKRSRWRLSRHRDNSATLGNSLSPRKALGADGAGASTSSIGSLARPRKSFTGDTVAVSESTLVSAHPQSSVDTASGAVLESFEKKGPLGWIKNKMREKREEKEAEKERNKSPPASTDRISSILPTRGKSVDIKREDIPDPSIEERAFHQADQAPQ